MLVPLPGFFLDAALVPFATVAVAMVAITVLVLGLVLTPERRAPLLTQMLLAFAVVGGGSLLLLALVFAFVLPNGTVAWTWVLLAFNFMMGVPVGLWFVTLLVYRDRRVAEGGWFWPVLLGAAATGSEVLMGVLFAVGDPGGTRSVVGALAVGLSSVWYFWSMAAVMASLLRWARLLPAERTVARGLLATAALAPWVGAYPVEGGLALTAVMTLVLAAVLRLLLRQRVGAEEAPFLVGIAVAFVAMTLAGLGLVAGAGSYLARIGFGSVMGFVMGGEVAFLVRSCYRAASWGAPSRSGSRPGPASADASRA